MSETITYRRDADGFWTATHTGEAISRRGLTKADAGRNVKAAVARFRRKSKAWLKKVTSCFVNYSPSPLDSRQRFTVKAKTRTRAVPRKRNTGAG